MKPIGLFLDNHEKAVVGSVCGKCGRPQLGSHRTLEEHRQEAEACCKPRECQTEGCGFSPMPYYGLCPACKEKLRQEEAELRFNRAVKMDFEAFTGKMFYAEDCDKYYHELEEYLQDCFDCDRVPRAYVWATTENKLSLNPGGMIETALEEHHEDAGDQITQTAMNALEYMVHAWAEQQKIVSYETDNSCALMLPPNSKVVEVKARIASPLKVIGLDDYGMDDDEVAINMGNGVCWYVGSDAFPETFYDNLSVEDLEFTAHIHADDSDSEEIRFYHCVVLPKTEDGMDKP